MKQFRRFINSPSQSIVPVLWLTLVPAGAFNLACGSDRSPPKPIATPVADKGETGPEADEPRLDRDIGFDPIVGPEIVPDGDEPKLPEFSPEIVQAIAAALHGPEWKGAEVFGHIWNIKPLAVSQTEAGTEVTGRISHHLPLTPDNQIDYRFLFANGELLELSVQIREGGWLPFAGPILKIVEQFSGLVLPIEFLREIYQQLADSLTGDWREQSQRLAAILALEAYRQNEVTRAEVP